LYYLAQLGQTGRISLGEHLTTERRPKWWNGFVEWHVPGGMICKMTFFALLFYLGIKGLGFAHFLRQTTKFSK